VHFSMRFFLCLYGGISDFPHGSSVIGSDSLVVGVEGAVVTGFSILFKNIEPVLVSWVIGNGVLHEVGYFA